MKLLKIINMVQIVDIFVDRKSDGTRFLDLRYSIEVMTPEPVVGATFYSQDELLVYSSNILTIVDLTNNTQPQYKYLQSFNPRKLGE